MPEPAAAFPGNPFWDFSLAVYGRAGVGEACVALQDRHGLDVNLLLLCCWAATRGRGLDATGLSRLVAAVAGWQREVVRPLRGVRRWLKTQSADAAGPAGALRAAVKAQELEAERVEQFLLFEAMGTAGAGKAGVPSPA
ncbi:MAG: TIGR02444 family protein, partial [Kiloniellales bacterium]